MNGAEVLGAWFTVDAPELCISALGELTNGVAVKVEKVGGGGEWTVYYSLDGSEPTAGSTKCEGPFALPASATVKAVAISAGGVSSEVASKELVLSPALAVEDAKARQRYPWNGKVDIDCEVKGDAAKKYAVTFVVEDEIGHTNLPIRTVGADVLGGPQPQNNENALDGGSGVPGGHALPFVLSPGKYRFVWDAAADLPKGTRFGGVSVSIDAVPSPLADWKRVVEITVDGYAGSETLTDVPVLVRLSAAIDGFDYADFAAPDTGADMIFTDMEGTARYTYEIDEWHADGESLVWVKLPELRKGTKFLLAYGKAETGNSEQVIVNSEDQKHEVWRDYAGVWHMNEDSGTAYDSTAHGLDALPESSGSTIDEMVSNALGACGKSRYNAKTANDNRMRIPSYDALTLGSHFVASGWFRVESISGWPKLFFRNIAEWSGGGWGVETSKNDPTQLTVVGASSGSSPYMKNVAIPDLRDNWVCLTFVYDGTMVSAYANGEFSKSGEILPAGDNGAPLYVGSVSSGGESCYVGQYDEIRLRGGTLSADRIKADYDMIANRDFCTYGKVEAGPGAEPVPPTRVVTITFDPNGGELAGAATRVYKGNRVMFGELPEPTRTGYAFGGWSLTQDGTAKITSSDFVPDMDKVVFATWTAATYSVKFNANGGTGTMADESFTYGTAKALTANAFTRTGYTFDGWATSADGAKVYSDKEVVSNLETTQGAIVNLYAVWKGALYMVVDLSGGASAESYPVSYLNAVPSGGWSDTYKTTKLVLRRCDPGTFMMQGKKSVTLTKTFYIAIYEMTVGQDKKIAGRSYTDYHDADALTEWDRYADSLISYNTIRGASKGGQWPSSDAVDSSSIIGKLRSKTSLKFDLPTEAQWEYACRAGKTTLYNDGSSDGVGLGYFESRYGSPTIVGKYKANAWGIYDMHGNVLEHVLDWYGDIATTSAQDPLGPGTGTNRSCRGGSFRDCKAGVYGGQVNNTPISESGSKVCTSNSRVGIAPDLGCAHSPDYTSNCPELGFRVVVNQ